MHAEAEQTQIVTIIEGRVLEIVLKIDMYAERQIQMHSMILDSEENNQILLPRGAFHGYHVLSDKAIIHYSSDTLYMPVNQLGVNWKSRQLIDVWGDIDPLVSNRDYTLPQIDLFIQNNSRSNP